MEEVITRNGYLVSVHFNHLVSRPRALMAAFWAGLAAPAMLFAKPTAYVLYHGSAGLNHAWFSVGDRLTATISSDVG